MPNWCMNRLIVKHQDPKKLEEFVEAWNSGGLLGKLIPCPKELRDTMSGSHSDPYQKQLHEFQMELNKRYFGYKDWYDWCIANWGTKWDIGRNESDAPAEIVDGRVVVGFDSAWSPPRAAYETLIDRGFVIDAHYYEPGMGFCGRYDEDGDFYLEIRGDSKWVRKNIPRDIDETFCISEDMMEMEMEES